MATQVTPISTEPEYEAVMAEVGRLWGARSGTPDGDRLDRLATLIDAYEAEYWPMDTPDPVEVPPCPPGTTEPSAPLSRHPRSNGWR